MAVVKPPLIKGTPKGRNASYGNPYQAVVPYIAGIIDGEGYMGIRKCKRKSGRVVYAPMVSVKNTNREVLDFCCLYFGGKVYTEQRVSPSGKTFYAWQIVKRKLIINLLETVLPYLIIKKKEAEALLEFFRCCSFGKKRLSEEELSLREEAYQLLRKLKKGERVQRLSEGAPERVKRQSELVGNHEREVEAPPRQ